MSSHFVLIKEILLGGPFHIRRGCLGWSCPLLDCSGFEYPHLCICLSDSLRQMLKHSMS